MGCCSGRCFLITICVLQLIVTIERQVFDFLGFMWAPIIGNFLHIIFLISGFFGAIQYRPKITIVYVVWCLIWLGCNIFVICFYLEVGILNRDDSWLGIVDNNKSWWFDNGIGCKVNESLWDRNNSGSTGGGSGSRDIPPEHAVHGCLLEYYYVEIIQAGVQCILALMGFCIGCYVIYIFTEEDDSSQPVHDELEYIKMRYKCPAQQSFRDVNNKTYQTVNSPDHMLPPGGVGGQRGGGPGGCMPPRGGGGGGTGVSAGQGTQRSVDSAIKQTEIPGWEGDYEYDRSSPGGTHGYRRDTSMYADDCHHESYQHNNPPPSQTHYNIIGDTQGVTVI